MLQILRKRPDSALSGASGVSAHSFVAGARSSGSRIEHDVTTTALQLQDITRRFGQTLALDGASFALRPGSVHALLGENGAGKTTLMRVAFGMVAPDAGHVRVDGVERRFASPADAMRAGLGMVHQHFALVAAMTVAENVALGGRGRFDHVAAAARVREIGARTGLLLDPDALAGDLGVGAQQRLEIVKALAREARVLVLDEPTAVLAPAEARELLGWVRAFASAGGAAVLITHKLREALAVADDVTVLRRGRTVLAARAGDETEASLAAAMLGEQPSPDAVAIAHGVAGRGADGIADEVPRPGGPPRVQSAADRANDRHPASAQVVLRARDLVVRDGRGVARVQGASLEVRAGEIVGVAAVEGAGQHELLRALAGRLAPTSGTVERPDVVGFVPEDRHRDAAILDFTLAENVALAEAGRARGWMDWVARRRATAALLDAHDVRASGPDAPLRALSGGNQQKLVLARELAALGERGRARALVVENPTRGLDIRAAADVAARLRAARDAGVAVVVHAADLDEVLALADRVVVVHEGRVHEVPKDREAVGRAMLGAR
jgi:general nucleoside transport system ATP-binding protein